MPNRNRPRRQRQTPSSRLWVGVLVAVLSAAAVATAEERQRPREGDAKDASESKDQRIVQGVALRVEGTNLIIGVGDAQRETVVPTEPDTEILVNGEKSKLADIPAQSQVKITQVQGLTRQIDSRPGRRK